MKKILLVLVLSTMSYALEAPYLISATALSDSRVVLAWRNNDVTTTGFIIQRKDSSIANFKTIDSIESPFANSYVDLANLIPQTLYIYQMLAYNASSVSVPSNTQQTTTLVKVDVFMKPSIKAHWDFDTSKSVKITIFDNSNCETGYIVYRDEGFSGLFGRRADLISVNPGKRDSIIWYDSSIVANTWYNFKIAVFRNSDSIFSEACSTYTFRGIQQKQVVKFEKLGEIPVSATVWSTQSGDSIICKEKPSPSGQFSIINAKDGKNPKFEGYMDSISLLSFPLQTMIPVFLKYGVSNSYIKTSVIKFKDGFLVWKDSTLRMIHMDGGNFITVDSLPMIRKDTSRAFRIILISDTILAIQYYKWYDPYQEITTFSPVYLSYSGFSSLPDCFIGNYRIGYIHGIYENKILISVDFSKGRGGNYQSWHELIVYDLALRRKTVLTTKDYPILKRFEGYTNAFNTGCYLSKYDNLCTNELSYLITQNNIQTELFVADIRNPYSHWFDSLNNAIYRDAVHKQNQLQNILLDTLKKRVFLVFDNNLTILGYSYAPVGIANRPQISTSSSRHLSVFHKTGTHTATILLPTGNRSSDLLFYDLSGRQIDVMRNVTSNAVLWRPKTRSMGCYFVVVKSGGEKYVERFIMR